MSSRNESRLNTPKDSRGVGPRLSAIRASKLRRRVERHVWSLEPKPKRSAKQRHWQRRLDELQRSFAVSAREASCDARS